ncbi:hypothetical protein TspCOW1_27170 [Thiohalobacter sp. COW1]|uniref:Polyketide synthase n=1 Tax=Thiohalobacter thiocyanaticus TaxID=585455 RepID=A0A1Z4VLD6_9GAMM|nr:MULTISPECIES: hypothetical protein [Thiohalobacter]BAZ92411.1 polyketide synthase [Thiohalobacter thiocyanaticus]BCO32614.1 hypothetical protein TspCOW1_27170 [Thiohalobacter sp. COW1]
MTDSKKILLIHAPHKPVKAGESIDLSRLADALRARGAEVESLAFGERVDYLLDQFEAGALPVVFRGEQGA